MEEFANHNLPVIDLLPQFMLGFLVISLFELAWVHFRLRQAKLGEYAMAFKAMGFNVVIGIAIGSVLGPISKILFALWGASLTPFHAGLSPLGCLYGLFIYEMSYWLQHWLAHKVRLLWCLHSPHHAPNSMHLWVGLNHSFLETIFYMAFTLGFIPAILGVDPVFIAVIAFVDAAWGNLLHLSDKLVTSRLGIFEKFLQTPSYHRVHHAQNVRYMDTNYNSITLLGDWLMGTLQPLDDKEPVQYGITRQVNTSSFWDVHFGEFLLLWRDLKTASSLREVLGYLFSPPGWKPAGEQQTAAARKLRELWQP
jgi:sterol desaturase/sphingolipid hydroxylase (fatty acid hydroxylase superfamily)